MAIPFVTTLDDSQFQAGLKNMEKGGKKVEGSLTGSFNSMAKGIGASMAAAFTVQAVVGAAKSILDFVGQLQDQADALGVNTEILQGFQGAMMGSGVSAEKFTKGMATLISSIQQAKQDTGTARDSFAALGIEFDSIANDSPDQILLKIADGLKNAKDPAAAYAAALDLVGKNQINFVAALKGGSAELQKSASQIKTLSDEEVAAIDEIGLAWDKAVLKAKAYSAQALLALAKPKGIVEEIGTSTVYNPSMQYGMGMGRPSDFKAPMEKPEMLGPEYTPPVPVVEDPRETKRLKDLKEFYAETEKYEMEKQQDIAAYEKDKLDDLKKFYEETEKYEMEKQQDIAAYQKEQAAYQKEQAKELQKQAIKKDIKQADKTLQELQKVTAKAEDKTKDTKGSLERALLGNPDRKPNKLERQVKRMMDDIEKGKPVAKSARRGTGKALEEFKLAKDAEKAAKDAEKKAEQQQEKMVIALEEINKGINGK